MKSYSTYIFDWDGCLAKTMDIWFKAFRHGLELQDIHLEDKQITAMLGDWKGPTKAGVKDLDKFIKDVDRLAKQQLVSVDLYPEVKNTLSLLKKGGAHIGMVSSSILKYVEPALKRHDIFSFFDIIITGEQVTHHKPDPEGINKVIKELGSDKNSTIMVGDMDKDVLAAHNASIDSALFFPDHHNTFYSLSEFQKSNPTITIKELSELLPNMA